MSNKIGLGLAVIAGVNAMVGASIFVNPAALATQVGPAALLIYAFVVVSVILMALGLAHVAAHHQEEGAFYVYARSWGGHVAGSIASLSYLIGLVLAMATLTKITGIYLQDLLQLNSWGWLSAANYLGLLALWGLTALNMAGATLTAAGQIVLVILTFLPVIGIMGLCLYNARLSNLEPFMPYGVSSLQSAIKYVIFGFFGFETAAALYSVVERPEKNVSRAITLATLLVGLIYVSFIGAIFVGIPREVFTHGKMPLAQALQHLLPNATWLTQIIGAAIVVTIMGTLHSLIWSLAELLRATLKTMGAAQLSTRTSALIIGLLVTAAFTQINNIDLFFCLTAIFLTLAYGMSLAALFKNKHAGTKIYLLAASGLLVCTIIGLQAAYDLIGALAS